MVESRFCNIKQLAVAASGRVCVAVVPGRDTWGSCLIAVAAGASHRAGARPGVAHFVEHMLRRRHESLAVISAGNAHTTHSRQIYWSTFSAANGDEARTNSLRAVVRHAQALLSSQERFAPDVVEGERKVILQERKTMFQQSSRRHEEESVNAQVFLPACRLSWSILGSEDDVHEISADDLDSFHRDAFANAKIACVISANAGESLADLALGIIQESAARGGRRGTAAAGPTPQFLWRSTPGASYEGASRRFRSQYLHLLWPQSAETSTPEALRVGAVALAICAEGAGIRMTAESVHRPTDQYLRTRFFLGDDSSSERDALDYAGSARRLARKIDDAIVRRAAAHVLEWIYSARPRLYGLGSVTDRVAASLLYDGKEGTLAAQIHGVASLNAQEVRRCVDNALAAQPAVGWV